MAERNRAQNLDTKALDTDLKDDVGDLEEKKRPIREKYDTDNTYLIKLAGYYEVPRTYILTDPESGELISFFTILDRIDFDNPKLTLQQYYDKLEPYSLELTSDDIVYWYYLKKIQSWGSMDPGQEVLALKAKDNVIKDREILLKEINTFYHNLRYGKNRKLEGETEDSEAEAEVEDEDNEEEEDGKKRKEIKLAEDYDEFDLDEDMEDEDEEVEEKKRPRKRVAKKKPEEEEKSRFPTYEALALHFNDFFRNYGESQNISINQAQALLNHQATLQAVQAKLTNQHIEINRLSFDLNIKVTRYGLSLDKDNLFDVFNESKVSSLVPYIVTTGDQHYHKLYVATGQAKDIPRFEHIKYKTVKNANYIRMVIWLKSDTNKGVNDSNSKDFLQGYINLADSTFNINVSYVRQYTTEFLLKAFSQAFPTLTLSKTITERTTKATCNIYFDQDAPIIYAMADQIRRDQLLASYLYLGETTKPISLKDKLEVNYLTSQRKRDKTSITITPSSNEEKTYFALNISSPTSNFAQMSNNIDVFVLLLNYMLQSQGYRDSLVLYKELYPEIAIELRDQIKVIVEEKKNVKVTKIKELKVAAPNIFYSGYAGACQGEKRQPKIIDDDEVDKYEAKDYQVMKYPRDKPEYNFICTDPTDEGYKYPGVILSTNPDKAMLEKYPVVPCCFKDDQMTAVKSKYYKYYVKREDIAKTKTARGGAGGKTIKTLNEGKSTFITFSNLQSYFRNYRTESGEFMRYGVMHSPNSFLHCVCLAAQDKKYLALEGKARETYVIGLRRFIASHTSAALYKQELYDYNDKEIKAQLEGDKFLDPLLYYRGVEEAIGVNIFIFAFDRELGPLIKIPRYKLFHSHVVYNERPTILILRNEGIQAQKLEYPQCELIGEMVKNKDIFAFGFEMTEYLKSGLLSTETTYTWQANSNQVRIDLYSRVNFISNILGRPFSQYIDSYGKMRALNFKYKGDNITMVVPPSAPFNLPADTKSYSVHINTALSLFTAKPTASSLEDGKVVGLWYQVMDLEEGVFIPVIPTDNKKEYPQKQGNANPIQSIGVDVRKRIMLVKKTANILIQVIEWLFSIAKAKLDINAVEFMDNYTTVDNYTGDSVNYYDYSRLEYKLPQNVDLKEALQFIEKNSNIVKRGKIVLYNEDFAQRIEYTLEKYDKQTKGLEPIIAKSINRSFVTASDFEQANSTYIFTSDDDFNKWKQQYANRIINNVFKINTTIDIKVITSSNEPYVYLNRDDKIYLIQKVFEGDKLRAINVANTWAVKGKNTGYNTAQYTDQNLPSYAEYTLDSERRLILLTNVEAKKGYLRLLRYNGRYAALLDMTPSE